MDSGCRSRCRSRCRSVSSLDTRKRQGTDSSIEVAEESASRLQREERKEHLRLR